MNAFFLKTTDVKLVAALNAMGIATKRDNGILKTIKGGGKEEILFLLETKSNCGKYKTEELVRAYNDIDFVKNNPEHPFAYIKAYIVNNSALLDLVKSAIPFYQVEVNGKLVNMPANITEREQDKLFNIV